MTKKDYELITEAIRYSRDTVGTQPQSANSVIDWVVAGLCQAFKRNDPKFQSKKFWEQV